MGLIALNPAEYGRLCATVIPKVIETDDEFDRMVEVMEALDRKADSIAEEATLRNLLATLIKDYDDRIELPDIAPHAMVAYLMEWRGLRQADLLPVFGSRSVTSDVIAGNREPSKSHIRKLAAFFHVSPQVFL